MNDDFKISTVKVSTTQTEQKPDLTAPYHASNVDEIRTLTKTDSLKMIDNCLSLFTKIIDEGVTIQKCDALNELILKTLMLLDVNLSSIIAMDNDLIYTNKEMTELDPTKMMNVYELVLWKRINTHLDDQYKMGIIDNIDFIRDIKNYINNVCWKNINVSEKKK